MKTPIRLLATGTGLIMLTGMLSAPTTGNAQDKKPWVAPAAQKSVKNPVKADAAAMDGGKLLYDKHCKSCHGTKGKGDGPKAAELETPTGDFSEKEFQAQTDGELFWKAKEGNGDMPSFKKKITDDAEYWQMINYIRTFKPADSK